MVRGVRIGGRRVGDGELCFVVAEAGSNHNGLWEQAVRLVDVAASAGADGVKFQVFRADRLYPKHAGTSDYLNISRSIYDIIAESEMPYDWLPDLAAHCHARDVLFLASAFDEESADRLVPYVDAFKIASYELTHIPLIRHVARSGKPVIVSTGGATLDEVAESVDAVRETGNEGLILTQCTAAYPAPLESLNIRVIPAMKAAFGVPVGLSDHSRDPLVGPLAAVAVGANLLEKHFTLSNELPGVDHRFAVEPGELRTMVQKLRETEHALGGADKAVHPVEEELRAFARRSVFAVRDIKTGELLTRENVAVLRCGKLPAGLPPREFDGVLGKRARRDIPAERGIVRDDYA